MEIKDHWKKNSLVDEKKYFKILDPGTEKYSFQ